MERPQSKNGENRGPRNEQPLLLAKATDGFFDSDEIRAIESQENGGDYICFWLKLLIRAIQQEEPGRLRFKETIPYTDSLLASVTKTDIDIVRSAMKVFQELGMVEIVPDGTI